MPLSKPSPRVRRHRMIAALTPAVLAAMVASAAQTFPQIEIRNFDPTAVHPDARRFQLADYDATRHRVLFYPEGDFPFPVIERHPTALGVLLVHDAGAAFTDRASWRAYDLKKLVSPRAGGFCGGFLDAAGEHAYLVPLYDIEPGKGILAAAHSVPNGLAVKIDLVKKLDDSRTYHAFDIAKLGFAPIGYCSGAEAEGFAYFGPTGTGEREIALNGTLLRHDTRMEFTERASWQWFDLKSLNRDAAGFQAVAYVAPYVYLVPYLRSVIVRYDTRKDFRSTGSYQTFDLKRVTSEPLGLCGVIVAGRRLVMTPLIDSRHLSTISTAVLFDTARPFGDAGAWKALDLRRVDPHAAGYQSGWADKNGYVWLVPDSSIWGEVPPLIVWNSHLPFDDEHSWKAYGTRDRIPASTGAAYDPVTNRAWLSSYGSATEHDLTEIEIR